MKNMKTKILIKKLSGLIVEPSEFNNFQQASTFAAAMLRYGFAMDQDAHRCFHPPQTPVRGHAAEPLSPTLGRGFAVRPMP